MTSVVKKPARIGWIIPSVNTLSELQLTAHAPSGTQFHFTRSRLEATASFEEHLPGILDAAALLADCKPDLIAYHCTAISMSSGIKGEQEVLKTLGEHVGLPVMSTGQAICAAMTALGARRLVMVTPYTQHVNDLERAYLEQAGMKVLGDVALGMGTAEEMSDAGSDLWVEAVIANADPQADAYLISCTNIKSVEAINEIEKRLKRPVVTSNQAALWYALRNVGVSAPLKRLGKLLQI